MTPILSRYGRRFVFSGLLLTLAAGFYPGVVVGQQGDRDQYELVVNRAIAYLKSARDADGSYSPSAGPGVTALVTAALLRHDVPRGSSLIAPSLRYLERLSQPDGGIYRPGSLYRNYETCLAILCFSEANDDGKYDELLRRADAFVKGIQWNEDEGKTSADFSYGGAGYGKHARPDLSNTSFLVEALVASGNDANSEAIQQALLFVSRCQNLESEHNITPFATKNPDGGFYYTCAAGGSSQAGTTDNGGLRSYGSMTYAGLKSMIYAGVGPDDPRVKAAVEWIKKFYRIDTNPGMGRDGLYYYYHTFAKSLDAIGKDVFVDAEGRGHNWRQELLDELARRQQADGSWVNESSRWLESDANLVTGYALLALSYCKPEVR